MVGTQPPRPFCSSKRFSRTSAAGFSDPIARRTRRGRFLQGQDRAVIEIKDEDDVLHVAPDFLKGLGGQSAGLEVPPLRSRFRKQEPPTRIAVLTQERRPSSEVVLLSCDGSFQTLLQACGQVQSSSSCKEGPHEAFRLWSSDRPAPQGTPRSSWARVFQMSALC